MGDDDSREDQRVLEVLLDDVEREPAVAVQGVQAVPVGTATPPPTEPVESPAPVAAANQSSGEDDARAATATAPSAREPWRVREASVALALETARSRYGSVRVAQAYRRRNWWGKQEVILELEPAAEFYPGAGEPASALGNADGPWAMLDLDVPRAWSRAALREVGFPVSLLRRLPVEDPLSPGEWEDALRRIILGTLLLAPRQGPAQVHGQGARGAALMLEAAEQGFALGFLDYVEEPVTSERILQALRRAMPPWRPYLNGAALDELTLDAAELVGDPGEVGGHHSKGEGAAARTDEDFAASVLVADDALEADLVLPSGAPAAVASDAGGGFSEADDLADAKDVVADALEGEADHRGAEHGGAKGRGRGRRRAGADGALGRADGDSEPKAAL